MSAESNHQIDPILRLLSNKARYCHHELAEILELSTEEVEARIAELESNGTILGYKTIIDSDLSGSTELKTYKQHGFLFESEEEDNRLSVSP